VTTKEEAILCALARSDGHMLRLIPTRYTIPTDNVTILSVCGTPDGRIFLGGFDGSLFEMTYESLAPSVPTSKTVDEKWNDFYDGSQAKPDMTHANEGMAGQILSSGKRAFSTMMIGSARPHKCRKLNHSQSAASSVLSAIVPDFVLKASSSTFWSSDAVAGGITKIVHDVERQCIYTLSAKGWISSYDLRGELKMTSQMDAVKTARVYLEAVSRGHMHPPSSPSDAATIAYPGGAASAQAGVGGMDGARSILKLADLGVQPNGRGRGHKGKEHANILTPVSIHVISRSESGRLTLLAITAGGLRYFLSSLSPSVLNSGPGSQNQKGDPLAPHRTFTMCHVRAPPPVDSSGIVRDVPSYDSDATGVVGGVTPRLGGSSNNGIRIDAAHYKDGVAFLAIEHKESGSTGTAGDRPSLGNMIVATASDAVARKKTKENNKAIIQVPGGVSESFSLPMSSNTATSGVLPGGRIMDANSVSVAFSSLIKLVVQSQTPSDSDLANGLAPAYFPPSKVGNGLKAKHSVDGASHSPLELAASSRGNGSIVRSNGSSASASSIVLTGVMNFLLSRPLGYGLTYQHSFMGSRGSGSNGASPPLYRISKRYGCAGFSNSAGERANSDHQASVGSTYKHDAIKSARLSPWLLKPAVVPLNQFALHHLTPPGVIVALNVGGTHYFQLTSILASLADALMSAGANVGNDEAVSNFFTSYGSKEGCAMCLMLAIGSGPASGNGAYSDELRNRACQAALSKACVPTLIYKGNNGVNGDVVITSTQRDQAIPSGYDFKASYLNDGLNSLASRLLRPIWFKPAVVVTEGQTFQQRGGPPKIFPAKVELLLDDESLEEVRQPLVSLQRLMREVLAPAVTSVPGVESHGDNAMDVDDFGTGQSLLITGSMLHLGQLRSQNGGLATGQLSPRDAELIARLVEERSLHSLYRLLSRTVQLLRLLSLLKRAQLMADMPEVEWGLVHGVTISQLVQTREGQDRIETVLNALVSNNKATSALAITPAADADNLANMLATQCYLYYSPGSRFAYLGFRDANEALSCAPSTARRTALTNQAVTYLKQAASFWCSAPMVTGRTLQSKDKESYSDMALRALQYDSPLARAATKLIQLGDVVALVDVCLATSANFGGTIGPNKLIARGEDNKFGEMFKWEQGLYHKRRQDVHMQNNGSSSSSSSLVVGANVTQEDALNTCYALILHHLILLLETQNPLAVKMLSACAAAADKRFLHALFEHLLARDQSQTLLRINSKELEEWLQKDDDLLYRYYVVQGQHSEAGRLMWSRANMDGDVPLDQRLEWLTKSRNSYNTALDALTRAAGWNEPSTGNLLEIRRLATMVQEAAEVAQLQRGVLYSVNSTNLESQLSEGDLSKLKSTLVGVSDLYNVYAAPLNLFESCLFILLSCRENSRYIPSLWTSVLCEEILPCATRSQSAYVFLQQLSEVSLLDEQIVLLDNEQSSDILPLFEHGYWVDKLKLRFVSLGKELFGKGADYVCPVDFLAGLLEELRHTQQKCLPSSELSSRSSEWPLQALSEIGVPYSLCLSAYETIVMQEEKERMGGVDPHSRFLHLRSIVEVLENWVLSASRDESAAKDLKDAVTTGMLMSRIDKTKANMEELMGSVIGEEATRVYERLLSSESSIKRLL
jgi:nuclear pore complex protein Nup155